MKQFESKTEFIEWVEYQIGLKLTNNYLTKDNRKRFYTDVKDKNNLQALERLLFKYSKDEITIETHFKEDGRAWICFDYNIGIDKNTTKY